MCSNICLGVFLRSSTEDCLVLICCGLYDLLRGILLLLPDLMLEEVMDKLIQPDALIVLVNHSSPLIQQGVMKVGFSLESVMYCKAEGGLIMHQRNQTLITLIFITVSSAKYCYGL